jgi:hypothetical protein
MVFEHVSDSARACKSTYRPLAPGRVRLNFHLILYRLPFLAAQFRASHGGGPYAKNTPKCVRRGKLGVFEWFADGSVLTASDGFALRGRRKEEARK